MNRESVDTYVEMLREHHPSCEIDICYRCPSAVKNTVSIYSVKVANRSNGKVLCDLVPSNEIEMFMDRIIRRVECLNK